MPNGSGGGGRGGGGAAPAAAVAPGVNTVVWNLQYPAATSFPGMILCGGSVAGPPAPPGTYQVRNRSRQDPLNFPIKLNNRLASLLSVVSRGDGRPLGNAAPIFDDLVRELKVQTGRLSMVLTKDLAAFDVEARWLGLDDVQ